MIIYFIIALVWGVFIEWVFEVTDGELDNTLRILNFIFYPVAIPLFGYYFIKEFIN